MKHLTVLLADDHLILREGLRALLEVEGDIKVLCETDNGRTAVEMAMKLSPDVVIMDIAMPLLNGLEAARQILQARPACRILMLSGYEDDAQLEQALEIGVAGFLIKQTSVSVLAKAVRAVADGESFFSPSICARFSQLEKIANRNTAGKRRGARLTGRQTEILQLIAEGMPNKLTAAELGISIKTVGKHRQRLMDKLNVHDTAGLTRHAIATGMIASGVYPLVA